MLLSAKEAEKLADLLAAQLPVKNVKLRQTHATGGKQDTMPTHYQAVPRGLTQLQRSPQHHEGQHDPGIWILTFEAGGHRHIARLDPENFYRRHFRQHHQSLLVGSIDSEWSSWRPGIRSLAQYAYTLIRKTIEEEETSSSNSHG